MNSLSAAAELTHEGGTSTPTGSIAPTENVANQHDDSNNHPTTNPPTPTAGATDLQQHDHQQPDDEVGVRQHERIDAKNEPPQPPRPLPMRRCDDGDQEDNESERQELPPRVAAEDILLESSSPAAGSSAPSSTSLLNREELRTLQGATTGLGILFVAVAVLTVLAVDQYRLVVLVGLLTIILAFYLLLRVVQHVTEHPAVMLHPAVHHWMRAVRTEYRHFVQDWREHVLLLTYPEDNGDNPESASPYRDMGDDDPRSSKGPSPQSPHRRPKSRIFRALVHPLAPWLSRRRERRQSRRQEANEQQHDDEKPSIELQQKKKKPSSSRRQQQQRKQQQSADETKNRPSDPSYVPPDYALV
jgi:hypothetical protein